MFRRQLAAVPQTLRLGIFQNACSEVATYVSKGLDRTVAADELVDMAAAHGLDDNDAVQFVISRAFEKIEDFDQVPDDIPDPEPQQRNGKDRKRGGIPFQSKADFVGGFIPPDYLIEGVLQRRFIYALT